MYPTAVGFNPSNRLLAGLSRKGDAGAAAYGQAMAGAAGLNMDRAQQNQKMAVEQMQQDGQQRMLANQNQTKQASNMSREFIARGDMRNRGIVQDIGFSYDSAAQQQRQQTQFQQMLLNAVARMF
jgi:hypothetical protein